MFKFLARTVELALIIVKKCFNQDKIKKKVLKDGRKANKNHDRAGVIKFFNRVKHHKL